MPTKKVTCRKDKAVLVSVYVEKPKKKRSSSSVQHHHHHHYHIHQTLRQEVVHHVPPRQGYDRRAGLLIYLNLLRKSARGASSTPFANNNLRYLRSSKTCGEKAPSKKKPKHAGRHACFVNWKLLIPSFLRSWARTRNKKKKCGSDKDRK